MGYAMIIRDADFSENAVSVVNFGDISSMVKLYIGYNRGNGNENDINRMGTIEAFDMSSFVAKGYKSIKITPKQGFAFVGFLTKERSINANIATADDSISLIDDSPVGQSWIENAITHALTYPFLQLGIKKTNDGIFSETEVAADYALNIILEK